jgi:hypothetical protein
LNRGLEQLIMSRMEQAGFVLVTSYASDHRTNASPMLADYFAKIGVNSAKSVGFGIST